MEPITFSIKYFNHDKWLIAECTCEHIQNSDDRVYYIRVKALKHVFKFVEDRLLKTVKHEDVPKDLLRLAGRLGEALFLKLYSTELTKAELHAFEIGREDNDIKAFAQDREFRRTERQLDFQSTLWPKLKELLKENIYWDEKKSCYTIKQALPGSKPLYYDFYPKANKVLIRHQNRWLQNGASWLSKTFDDEAKQKNEANAWRGRNSKMPDQAD